MADPKFDLTGDESDRDVERRSRPSSVLEDHLQTTRLPAISPPPIGIGYSSSPPSAVIAVAPRMPSFEPGAGESVAPSSPPLLATDPPSRPSLWKGLLTGTYAPSRPDTLTSAERVIRQRTASAAAALALVLVVTALVVGLRSPPFAEASVAATFVASRTALALGVLGVAIVLLRMAERLFFLPVDADSSPKSDGARARDVRSPAAH